MIRHLLAAALLLPVPALAQDYYSASLDAGQEVPPNASSGRGWAVVRHDPSTNLVRIFVHHESLTTTPVAAHLHLAPAGSNGGVIFGLTATGPNAFTGSATISAANATALQSEGTYINVHTPTFPGGEIRGPVVPSRTVRFVGALSGQQEVPPVMTTAAGSYEAYLLQPDNRLVYFLQMSVANNIVAAHLHRGAPGVNGPVVTPLQGLIQGGTDSFCGVTGKLSAADLAALLAGDTYFNVHTNVFGGGEIRGQVVARPSYVAALDGASQVPPNASPGEGGARLLFDADGKVQVDGRFASLTAPATVAHVHVGPPGSNGGVVFPLSIVNDSLSATYQPTAADLAALQAGNWYVNVHSGAFPGGEIRGQLEPVRPPTAFGGGCQASNGVTPVCVVRPLVSVGSRSEITLVGSAGGFAFLAFGVDRDLFGGIVPLPVALSLAGINAPGCYILVDPLTTLGTTTTSDGCASIPLPIPPSGALRGSSWYTQWIVLDPFANPGALVTSSAAAFTIR